MASSFMISHFELFGLQQTYYYLLNQQVPKPTFTARYFYRYVRHPLQLGMLIGIWATPHMSASHMFLSAAMTAYITLGLMFEERDLQTFLGENYAAYRRRVPMILPGIGRLSPKSLIAPPDESKLPLNVTPFSQSSEKR